ncbi:BJ4_G0014470.mRNA.1.CDS.1 [Saccharomyces cerevisiae]|nr:BJ4_G0014470.mRNA.1.CDS.1 [Saccharomyces cerevisiae]
MSEFKIVSRKDLYNEGEGLGEDYDSNSSSKNNSEHVEVLVPPTEFEFVEVERTDSSLDLKESNNSAHEQKEEKQEEFEFPLFSFGVVEASTSPAQEEQGSSTQEKDTPQTEVSLMKISLKEPEEEIINQERPKDYYFASHSADQKLQFQQSSIDYDVIIQESTKILEDDLRIRDKWPYCQGRIIDLYKHNARIELEQQKELKIKKRRPGQKQRAAKKLALERTKERDAKAREIKKQLKKKFHKRGGKKNKKKVPLNPLAKAGSTPKFRTE